MRVPLLWPALCLWVLSAHAGDVSYTVATAAGGTYAGDGRLAVTAQLGSPEGLVLDAAGNLYIADTLDHRVRKVTPTGMISTVAGDGYPGFRGDGGPARNAQLNFPYGLALDAAGNLYVADLGNGRVRLVSPDGNIRTVAGGGAAAAEGGEARAARLNQPRNLAVDSEGNLYISDFGDHRVYRVTPGGLIFRLAGVGSPGAAPDGEVLDAAVAPLYGPAGLALDRSGALYIADTGNHRIRRIDRGRLSTVPAPTGSFVTPIGLALNAAGDLYVADKSGRVMVVSGGTVRSAFPAGSVVLSQPHDVALDTAGSLYVSDRRDSAGLVLKLGPAGLPVVIAGDGAFRAPGDGGPPLFAHFTDPTGVAVDPSGSVYVADRQGHRVRIVSAGGITTLAGTGAPGSAGDGGPAATAQLGGPAGLFLDTAGNLWVAEFNSNAVRKIGAAGLIQRVVGAMREPPGYAGDGGPAIAARLNSPEHAAADSLGNVYVADTFNHVIRRVSPDGRIVTLAGKGVPGYAGDGGAATLALLTSPAGVCPAPGGDLYIADTGNHAIRKVSAAGTIVTVAGTGAPGFAGDGGPAAKAQLNRPSRIALDLEGNLFVADSANNRIRRIARDGTISTVAGTGSPGFSGDDGPALAAEFNRPWDIAVDRAGNLYVADRDNQRIRRLSPAANTDPLPPPGLEVLTLLNAASMLPGAVAPGEIVSLFGTGLGPGVGASAKLTAEGLLPGELGGTQVLFNGYPAALLYVQYGQVNLQVPYGVAGRGSTEVEVRRDGAPKMRLMSAVAETAPGIFTAGDGTGQAAASNQDHTANSTRNPALRGTIVTLYATGEGQTKPAGRDGAPAQPPYPAPELAVTLSIGGQQAAILYAGAAPGYAGLMQINARVPDNLAPGNAALILFIGGARSQPGVFLAVE